MASICQNCWNNGVRTYIDGESKCPRCLTRFRSSEPSASESKEDNSDSNNSENDSPKSMCDNGCFGSETWDWRH